MKSHMYRGSYLPILMKLLPITTGPILELGCGNFSTPFLHWSCHPTKRRLVTYENNKNYYNIFLAPIAGNKRNLQNDFHEVHWVKTYDEVNYSEPWSIAFVDQDPGESRLESVVRLHHAEYVVVHDTELRRSLWKQSFARYPYQYTYRACRPWATLLSRTHDLKDFSIP
jgi:hypothetical protein